jgi:flagellar hook-length control protein FliK
MQETSFMNIDSANFLSILPTQLATEVASLPTTGIEPQAGFLEALEAQLTQLSEGMNSGELLNSTSTTVDSSNPATLQSLQNLLGNGGDMQKLAAFFGKELPSSYKVIESLDQDTSLSALPDTMGLANTSEIQGVDADQQISSEPMKNVKVLSTDIQPDMAEIIAAIEGQSNLLINEHTTTETPARGASNQEITKESSDQERSDNLATALLSSLLSPLSISIVENKMPENPPNLTAIKPEALPSLMKNTPANNGALTAVVENSEPSEDFLQKQVSEQLSEQSKPVFNFNYFEKTDPTDKNGQIAQDVNLGGEKNLTRGVAEINQLNRHPAEIRAEVPGLSKPIGHPEWNKDLGERILWMNNRSIPSAEIKLNPQHLGPISVRVDMNQDQATISFAAQHGSVRDALEASIPKLRELLSAQQLNLTDVNVSQHFSSDHGRPQPQNFAETKANADQNSADFSNEAIAEVDNGRAIMTKGLLSIYA